MEQKDTGKIRDEIYAFIESKGIKLDHKDKGFLSNKIKQHSENREANLKDMARRFSFTQEKVAKYLKKAKTMPTSVILKTQENTLKLVSTWLNSDAE